MAGMSARTTILPIVADDWLCKDDRPITDLHWWGSWLGWDKPYPPLAPSLPKTFHIGIWTDVPAGADPDPNIKFSHPDLLVWENYCDNWVWNFAGYDKHPGHVLADNPDVVVLGSGEDFNWAAWRGYWVRGGSTGIKFTFNGIDTTKITGAHALVNFNLGVTNHLNGEEGLDGLVDITINPGDPDPNMTYCIKNVLFDNMDKTNLIQPMGGPGTYETKASMRVNKNYIQAGTLVIQVDRAVDIKDMLPVAPVGSQLPIDMCIVPPGVPPGCYDFDDAHTVHINIETTDATGTVAADGEVTISNIPSPIYDNPSVNVLGSGEDFSWAAWHGYWVRGNSTGIKFTFNGINTATISGSHILVNLNLGLTNHLNGEKGLDGLVDLTINPGDPDPSMTYCIANVLLDNMDYLNHIDNMGAAAGTYETRQNILVNKNYIQAGTLVIQIDRQTDIKDNLPAAPVGTEQPISMCTAPPTVPLGCYDNDDARTVHINVGTTDGTGTVAANGEVTISELPEYENETCFQFTQLLSQDEWFYQEPNGPNTVYWLSIAAIYNPAEIIDYPWGWKTRPHYFNDDAVRIWQLLPTGPPVLGSKWIAGNPIMFPDDVSWDVAFELTTNEPRPHDKPASPDLNWDGIVNWKDVRITAGAWLAPVP